MIPVYKTIKRKNKPPEVFIIIQLLFQQTLSNYLHAGPSAKFSLFMKMKMVKPKTVSAAENTYLQNKSAFIFENAQSFSSSQLTEREEMPAGGERRGKGS